MAVKVKALTEREQSIATLREWLKPGDKIHAVLRSVSASGMSRVISFHHIEGDRLMWLDWHIGRILGNKVVRTKCGEGLRIQGCGMDMGFHVVYEISRILFRDDPRWDAITADTAYPSYRSKDPGYALENCWL